MTTLQPPTPTEYAAMCAAVNRLLSRLRFANPVEEAAGHWALWWLNLNGAAMKLAEAREND